jgi:pimeloyl-ACP methyl ester carboxylesterase
MARVTRSRARAAVPSTIRDLSNGVIVVLSGGGFDAMNPVEVRARMDQYIADVNADPFVQANTGGRGLTFRLLPNQKTKHLHQAKWRQVCDALRLLNADPLILVGHSNGGAAAMDIARCLQSQGKSVDLLFSADSVLTLDDIGDINRVPANVKLNLNPYVIPTPAWLLAPFPIGTRNRRQLDNSLDGILNIGLTYNLPGALAHRNAFYDLAGGDKTRAGGYKFPHVLIEATLAVLRGETNYDIFHAAEASLQVLATKARIDIELETTNFKKTLRP